MLRCFTGSWRKQKIFTPQPGWMAFLLRLVVAVLVMSGVLLGMLHIMPEWSLGTMPWRLLRLMAVVAGGDCCVLCCTGGTGLQS